MVQGSEGLVYLRAELKRRALEPITHVTFWVYFVIGVLAFGGFGVWFEVFRLSQSQGSLESVHTALFTFFTALAGSSALQLIFSKVEKPLIAFAALYFLCFIGLAFWQSFLKPVDPLQAFGGVLVGCVLAIAMWWLTSGQDDAYKDDVNFASAVGGRTDVRPQGDLGDFKS